MPNDAEAPPAGLPVGDSPRWTTLPAHRLWLLRQAEALFDFFQFSAVNPAGGFFTLDDAGRPLPPTPGQVGHERQLHDTTRMVHCFAIAHLLGRPGADALVDHGMDFLWNRMRDRDHGGYFRGVDDKGATKPAKEAYGHAFVLLGASSALVAGHPDAPRMLADVTEVLHRRFWDAKAGATTEEYDADWSEISGYRGQNSNMHLTEALMAAFEATGERAYLDMAESIASLIIDRHARAQGWRVAEHFSSDWVVDLAYRSDDQMFRPEGTTPGHALEWSRLLVQLWELGGRRAAWMLDAAKNLFARTVAIGWAGNGGFFYTLDWDDRPAQPDRYWWPCAEGIGAAAVLGSVTGEAAFEEWYRRIWGFVTAHVIDRKNGGWIPELDSALDPVNRVFTGKPDLYHAVQACLIPLFPADGSVTRQLARGGLKLG